MKEVPALPYITIVRQFALSRNLHFFTWRDISKAAALYIETAKILN